MKTVNILGVKINDLTLNDAVDFATHLVESTGKHYIVTPNPEFLVTAYHDKEFLEILNKADLAIPDGIGLKVTGKIKNRVPGVDFMEKLCEVCSKKAFTIGLLGGSGKIAEKTSECLKKSYPELVISISSGDIKVDNLGNTIFGLKKLPQTDVLFVGLGQPKQEMWISKNLTDSPIKLMVGVGGAFDYISGEVPRAPKKVRDLGLEWLFRLTTQPWRLKRQLKLLEFIWLLLIH